MNILKGASVFGFKLMPTQFLQRRDRHRSLGSSGQLASFLKLVHARSVRLLVLEREDKLAQYVSVRVAVADGSCWHALDCRNRSVAVDPAKLDAFSRWVKGYYENVAAETTTARARGLGVEMLRLGYERNLSTRAGVVQTFWALTRFLRIDVSVRMEAAAEKAHSEYLAGSGASVTLSDRIANWPQLKIGGWQ
eukprot:CAMPEP_0183341640 /NCGR_PEP_ID=MMETSP0164_2-20130417/7883_1 /TAXON_ID=221442 /ORGANISM="Coccolithus pelagicus ssp braarudi, Strain PLY182g" /LENGTH=192 /DNA_ID=CAMNT_0025512025 /DNA_START=332 /DNA_END=911 /DNA_ORIENTATION=+